MASSSQYWLMKSEPTTYSIDDLAKERRAPWDGVRNYQARNMMRDKMRPGDLAFFYHSSCAEPGVVGVVKIASDAYPDDTAFDPKSPYYDPKSDRQAPRWFLVDVAFERKLSRTITLAEIKAEAAKLGDLALLRRGNRLSVMPVGAEQWRQILALE